MDGYLITGRAEDAVSAFPQDGVRHVAELDNGQGFLAFEGPMPIVADPFAQLLIAQARPVLAFAKVRKHGPLSADEVEHLAIVTPGYFSAELFLADVLAVSQLTDGLRLVSTTRRLDVGAEGCYWSATSTRIYDKRLEGVSA
jgi:hypothetical protein